MRRAFVAAVVLVSVGVGCSLALSFDNYSENVDCAHAVPPAKPNHDNPGKNLNGLVAAFSYFSLEGKDPKGNPITLGFDLDNLCTCPGASSCKPVSTGVTPPCDDPGTGRDNAVQGLLAQLKNYLPFNDQVFNASLRAGLFSQLIRIDNYNGTADDPDVDVAYLNGLALATSAGGPSYPTFQGQDSWLVERSSNGLPPYLVKGYVAGGVLVAKYVQNASKDGLRLVWTLPTPEGGLGPRLPISLTEATLTAKISLDQNGGLSLFDGRMGAKLTSSSALEIPRAFGQCSGPGFDSARRQFCALADLPNKDGLCDSLSFSMAFLAVPAKVGGEMDVPPLSACGDAGPAPNCLTQ